jgi:formylglycine-generating enzyme required for sulfatase activity
MLNRIFIIGIIVLLCTCASNPVPTVSVMTAEEQAVFASRQIPNGFVRINGGTFTMGSASFETGRRGNEGPQRQVTVNSFFMGMYLVTQKEYEEIIGMNPSKYIGQNLPVESVTWFDAIEYCNLRSQREGLTPVYSINGKTITWNREANGYRLPTEAEWEYACRAGSTTVFNNGNRINDDTGWYMSNSGMRTQEVGKKPANAWGLFDMHGNVNEWCWDMYSGGYNRNDTINPIGKSSGSSRIVRGGNYGSFASFLRSACRHYVGPSVRGSGVGFRIVRS